MHRHQPVSGKRLLGAVPEVGLIAGVHRNGASVWPRLVALYRLRRGDVRCMFGHRDVVRIRRVVLGPNHQAGHLVERIRGLPAAIGPVHRVPVDKDVVAVVDAAVFRRLRVDVQLVFADPRCPFVHAVRIAEVRLINLHPVVHRPLAMDPVAGFGRDAVELVALLPQRVRMPLDFRPRQLDVPHVLVIMVLRGDRNAVVIRPNERIVRENRIRQIRRTLRAFPVGDEVFAVFDGFRLDAVGLDPTRPRPLGLRLVGLFPERVPRIGAAHDHPALFRLQHDVGAVPVAGGAGIQHPLRIDIDAVHVHEVEHAAEARIPGHFRQLGGDAGEGVRIVAGVVQRADAALPDLDPRIGDRARHFRIGELHPAVTRKRHVGMVDVRGHLDVLGDDHLDVRIDVFHHVIVVFGVVQNVHVGHPADFAGARHVGLAGEHLAAVLRRVDDQGRIAMVPVADFFTIVVRAGLDLFAVGIRIQGQVERILTGMHREARAGPGHRVPDAGLVVAGPGVAARPEFPDVTGDGHNERRRPTHFRHVEIVTDAFAVMHRSRLDRARIARPADDQVLWRPGDLVRGIQVIVLEVHLVHLIDRHHVNLAAIEQLDAEGAGQRGINATRLEVEADLLPV